MTAIATLILAIVTFVTICQSYCQLREMKRQWVEEHKPIIEASLISINNEIESSHIQLINYGKGYAKNIYVFFDKPFIEGIPDKCKYYFERIQNNRYNLLPNSSILIPFCDLVNNTSGDGYVFDGNQISNEERNKLIKVLNRAIDLNVTYDNNPNYREILTFKLSYLIFQPKVSTIQGELNSIQEEISQLKESIKLNNG